MAEIVYLLCAVTSVACAILLVRRYRASRTKLLLWSTVCFVGLALNNVLLFVDLVAAPSIDLSIVRAATGLAAVLALLVGLIWSEKAS